MINVSTEKLLNLDQAAELLQVSKARVTARIKRGTHALGLKLPNLALIGGQVKKPFRGSEIAKHQFRLQPYTPQATIEKCRESS